MNTRMKTKLKKLYAALAGALFLISSGGAHADKGTADAAKPADQQQIITQLLQRIEALEKKLGAMEAKPPAAGAEYEQRLTKIEGKIEQAREESGAVNIDNNFALAGYATVGFMKERGDGGTGGQTFFANFNPIFLYSYQDKLLFTGELEVKLLSNGDTETELEQAHVTYAVGEHTLLNAGRFLLPFGTFSERLHPAWINKLGTTRPVTYNNSAGIFRGPPRDNGLQAKWHIPFGDVSKGTLQTFVANGPTYVAVGSDERLRFGKSVDADRRSPTVGGRLGFLPVPNAEIGLSYMGGKINNATANANREFRAASLDAEYHLGGLEARGEYINLNHDLNNGENVNSRGWYAQLSSRLSFLNPSLQAFEGVLRHGNVHRDRVLGSFQNVNETSLGINYYHSPFIKSAFSFSNYSANELDRVDLITSFAF